MSVRGGYKCVIAGKSVHLLMTLGAMEEIEDALKIASVNEAQKMIAAGNARAIRVFLCAMSRAGEKPENGFVALTDADARGLEPGEAIAELTAALNALAPDEGDGGGDGSAEKKD